MTWKSKNHGYIFNFFAVVITFLCASKQDISCHLGCAKAFFDFLLLPAFLSTLRFISNIGLESACNTPSTSKLVSSIAALSMAHWLLPISVDKKHSIFSKYWGIAKYFQIYKKYFYPMESLLGFPRIGNPHHFEIVKLISPLPQLLLDSDRTW